MRSGSDRVGGCEISFAMFGAVVGSTGWMEGGTKDIWDGTPPPPGEAHASFAVADGEALDEESHSACQSVVSTLQAVTP